MRKDWEKCLLLLLAIVLASPLAQAQRKTLVETRNAALRYWIAFAEMKDPPTDKVTADLLETTAQLQSPWDESKLGPILDANAFAIEIMQRATMLPDCDWGLEYRQGPRASIAYAPKARVLARLNTLYGIRALANGQTQKAVDAWLAGIRFSSHIGNSGGLIFQLIARMVLLSNSNAIDRAVSDGKFNETQKSQIRLALLALPETGFAWGDAWDIEGETIEVAVNMLLEAKDPRQVYEQLRGEGPQGELVLPDASGLRSFKTYMQHVGEALRLPPEKTEPRLEALASEKQTVPASLQSFIPSPQRVNKARAEVAAARRHSLQLLAVN